MASQLYWFNTVSQKSNDHLTILWGWFSCWVVIFLAKVLYCNCNYIYLLRSLKNSYQDQKYGYIPSLISKKANLKTGVLRKQSTPNFPKRRTLLTPWYAGGKKCSFFGKFGVLRFLETPVFRFFALSPYYQRYMVMYTWWCHYRGKGGLWS